MTLSKDSIAILGCLHRWSRRGKKARRMPPKVNSSRTASPLLCTDGQSVSMSVLDCVGQIDGDKNGSASRGPHNGNYRPSLHCRWFRSCPRCTNCAEIQRAVVSHRNFSWKKMTYITKFRDRAEAGLLLAKKLRKYANRKDVADFGVAARWSAGGS